MNRFKLVRIMMGSGWPSGHVAVDWYHRWSNKPGGDNICLNTDTQDADELITEIDQMIAELTAIRAEVPERFARWTQEYKKSENLRRGPK